MTIVEELRVELNRRNQTIESAVQRVLYWGHRAQQAERRADEAERQLGIARSQLEHLQADWRSPEATTQRIDPRIRSG